MWEKIFVFLLFIIWFNHGMAAPMRKNVSRAAGIPVYRATTYDHDFGIEPRRAPSRNRKEKSTTNRNPFLRAFSNLVRNVRIPVPTITWNMTNPLANLFNLDETNYEEVYDDVDYYQSGSSKRRRKNSRRRKTSQRNKHRRQPLEDYELTEEQQMQAIPNAIDPTKPLYFFDPITGQYFEVQQLLGQEPYYGQDFPNPQAANYYGDQFNAIPPLQTIPPPTPYETDKISEQDGDDSDIETTPDDIRALKGPKFHANKEDMNVPIIQNVADDADNEVKDQTTDASDKEPKEEESLRNAIGSFMKDDHVSRKRQRVKSPVGKKKKAGKIKARNTHKYYFLSSW